MVLAFDLYVSFRELNFFCMLDSDVFSQFAIYYGFYEGTSRKSCVCVTIMNSELVLPIDMNQ